MLVPTVASGGLSFLSADGRTATNQTVTLYGRAIYWKSVPRWEKPSRHGMVLENESGYSLDVGKPRLVMTLASNQCPCKQCTACLYASLCSMKSSVSFVCTRARWRHNSVRCQVVCFDKLRILQRHVGRSCSGEGRYAACKGAQVTTGLGGSGAAGPMCVKITTVAASSLGPAGLLTHDGVACSR